MFVVRFLVALSAPAFVAASREVFATGNSLLQVSQGSLRSSVVPQGIHHGDLIFLKVGETGNFVTAQENGEVHTHWDHRGEWQKFVVERADGEGQVISGDAVFLTAWTGKRITVEGAYVHAHWDHMGDWQRLIIEAESGPGQMIMPGSSVFFKGHTGARLDGGSADKPGEMHARFADQGTWQRFVVELADAAPQLGTTAPQSSTIAGVSTDVAPHLVSLKTWEHFQLIQSLRAKDNTCPNGTMHPASPDSLKFDCRLWKAALAQLRNMTEASASISPSMHDDEQSMVPQAQNISSGNGTALQALTQFKESDEYCANMLNGDFKTVGVAHVEIGMKQYWTQIFSRSDGTEPVDVSCYPQVS